jgi:hypothetical protein
VAAAFPPPAGVLLVDHAVAQLLVVLNAFELLLLDPAAQRPATQEVPGEVGLSGMA